MEFLQNLLLFVHFVGLAVLIGGFAAQIGRSELRLTPGMFHGALTMLVTGIALVGVAQSLHSSDPDEFAAPDNARAAVKLVVLGVIFAVLLMNRGKERVTVGPWLAVGVLGILNVGIAVFWQ